MAKPSSVIHVLVVTDDPSAPRQLAGMLDDEHEVRMLFADTSNAVTRMFKTEQIDMIVIQIDANDLQLLQVCMRTALEQTDRFVPVLAMIKTDDAASALAAANAGVEGFVSFAGVRQLKRLVQSQIVSLQARRDARQALRSLADIEDRYTLLLDSSSEAIAYIHEGLHIYANPAYLELFGFDSFDDLEGQSMLDLLSAGDTAIDLKQVLKDLANDQLPEEELELNAHRQDGSNFIATVDFSPARYGGEYCAQMLVREQIMHADPELEAELRKLRMSDQLTGLINAPTFAELVAEKLDSRAESSGLAVLALALDGGDELLERIGIGASDELVRQAAALLKGLVDESHELARLRDHTFALICDAASREESEQLASQLIDRISGRIIEVRDNSLTISMSVGLAVAGSEPPLPESLIEQAQSALMEALRGEGSSFVRYRPRISAEGDEADGTWAERLRHALDQNEFILVSSPITNMEDDSFLINEVETRLRPEDSDEIILPSVYLDAATRTGVAPRLDLDLMDRLQPLVKDRGGDDVNWLIPLTLGSLSDEEALTELARRVQEPPFDPARVIFGFREPEVREKLRPVRAFIDRFSEIGCRFALCDVGPEAPMESLLRHIKLDYVRLAPEMVQDMGENDALREQLSSLVAEAKEQGSKVISPPVENASDLATLWQFGILLVQGEFSHSDASA